MADRVRQKGKNVFLLLENSHNYMQKADEETEKSANV